MSLQLVLGNAGAGKTQYLYDTIIKESIKNPQKRYLVLVPEQFTIQTQREFVLRHPNKGIMNIDVLSFGRLAHRVFEEIGKTHGTVLDDEGKNLVLRKIAGKYESELKVFGKNLKKLGYINEIKSVISELAQYDISIEDLEAFKETLPDFSMLSYKLEDIYKVYKGFKEYLEGKYITGEELLDVLCSVIDSSQVIKGSVIAFDGFTGFTPVQNKLLGKLFSLSEKTYITVTIDHREGYQEYNHPYQLFALSKGMITSTKKIARDFKVQIDEPIVLTGAKNSRHIENEALRFLEKNMFRYSNQAYENEQNAISIQLMRNPQEECQKVVEEIRRLVRVKGYRYREIGIIATEVEEYSRHIKRVCEQYQIPLFTDQKRNILMNAFVEYLRSLLDMEIERYSIPSVLRFLKAGYAPFLAKEIEVVENYVIALGIKGYRKWQEPWIRRTKSMTEESLAELNHIRVKFIEHVDRFHLDLKKRKKTVKEIAVILYEFFIEHNIEAEIEKQVLSFNEEGLVALAKEHSQIYGVTMSLLDKFVELLGEESITVKEFGELLEAGFQECKIGITPPNVDSVVVGDLERSRFDEIKVLFVMGVNDGYLPGKMNTSGLLSESDRDRFKEGKINLKPGIKEQLYIQKFYLYLNLLKPTKKLYLSYSKTNSQGKSVRPAYLINEILKLYPSIQIREFQQTVESREVTKETALEFFIQGLHQKDVRETKEWKALFKVYSEEENWKEKVDMLYSANRYRNRKSNLAEETSKELYGQMLVNSVSRLEGFARCPFAHFVTYGLRAREREVFEFEAMDMGNVLHSALEKYAVNLQLLGECWEKIDESKREQLIERVVDESVTDYGNSVLYQNARETYVISRMKRLLKRSIWALTKQLSYGSFIPSAYEVNFGSQADLKSTSIQLLDGKSMKLKGKIDRIDLYETDERIYVKVIDYKSGYQKLDFVDMYYGLQLQLFVYLNAAVEREELRSKEKKAVPGGVFYFRIDDPIVETYDEERVEGALLESLMLDGVVNNGAEAIQAFDEDMEKKSYAIPVTKNKDGSLSKNSKAISEELFQTFSAFTNKRVREIGEEIVSGNVEIKPYKKDDETACGYCKYNNICRFDAKLLDDNYRIIKKEGKEQVIERIVEEMNDER